MKLSESSTLVDHRSPVYSMHNDTPVVRSTPFKLIASFRTDPAKVELLILAISVILLIIAMAGERVTFKMAVDNMVPYRLVLMQLIFIISVLAYGTISHLKQGFSSRVSVQVPGLPHSKLLIIALLDTVQFAGLTLSTAGVSPAMTVILLHSSTPMIVKISKYFFPERMYSTLHVKGSMLIGFAIVISFLSSFLTYFRSDINQDNEQQQYQQKSDPISCLLYISMAALYGFTTLYKEKAIIEFCQPTDVYHLNSRLFAYQIGFGTLLSPLIYLFQGIPNHWDEYPLGSFFRNIIDGISCFLGYVPDTDSDFTLNYDSSSGICKSSSYLIVGYVICNIIVLECIDRVLLNAISNNRILVKVMIFSSLLAFIILAFYDNDFIFKSLYIFNDSGDDDSTTLFDFPNIIAVIILLFGMEIYGRDLEPDVESVTAFVS